MVRNIRVSYLATFPACTSLASITLPAGVTTIGGGAFWGCTSLASITLPEGVTAIGREAFRGCSSLASVTLPRGVTTIGGYAFNGCSSLASITLPEGVTTIGKYAFKRCTSLASITLPETVTTIEQGAFFDCMSLAALSLPALVAPTDMLKFLSNGNNIQLLVMPYRDNSMKIVRRIAKNAKIVVFKHHDGQIEVVPGPAAESQPRIGIDNRMAADAIVRTKPMRTSWVAVLSNQKKVQEEAIRALDRFGIEHHVMLPRTAILAILEFMSGDSERIDRLVRRAKAARGAIKPKGTLYNWAAMDTGGKTGPAEKEKVSRYA